MILRYFLIVILALIGSIVSIIAGLISGELAYKVYSINCRWILGILNVNVNCVYKETSISFDDGPYIFLGLNQESPLETFIWPACIPIYSRYFLNIEFCLVPLIGWSFLAMRNYVIVRRWKSQAKKTVDRAAQFLKKSPGLGFCIQLDGYMKSGNILGPYKKGGIILAIKSNSKIIPVAIHGAQELNKNGELRVTPGTVTMNFLAPINCVDYTIEESDQLLTRLKELARLEFPLKTVT